MSEQGGEKTEKPTQKRLEEAAKKGQFSKSADLQTFFVLGSGLLGLKMTESVVNTQLLPFCIQHFQTFTKLEIKPELLQQQALAGLALVAACCMPVVALTMGSSLLAGGIQTGFRTASEALDLNWERVNPLEGLKKICSKQAWVQLAFSLVKLAVLAGISWSGIKKIIHDPVFHEGARAAEIARFVAESAFMLSSRVVGALLFIGAIDYLYQFWKRNQDLMMTRQDLKEELKGSEGDPHIKARLRRRRRPKTQRQLLAEVPTADVIVTNPTHLAIALKYDRKRMKAPKVIAKGSRLNAMRIREVAQKNQIPIMENKPLARMMFKHCAVGSEVPADLYAAVAEILAWVYKMNRYRYYSEQNQSE